MLKKILCLMLVLSLSLSVIYVVYAEGEWTEDVEDKYMVLEGLGIVNMSDDGVYTVFKNLSKSAFINFICNMIDENSSFTEIYNKEAIKKAEDAGIICAGQTDLNKPLCYDEAMTMLVRLLGYGVHAEAAGGFPHGYTAIANRLGLTDGIATKPGERFLEYDAIVLLYNAINCPYVDVVSIKDGEIVYGNTSDKTFLYEYRNIYKVEGVVEAVGKSSLRSNVSVRDNEIVVDSFMYNTTQDFSDTLGKNVEMYVKENKTGLDSVLYVIPVGNNELLLDADDIVKVGDDVRWIEYTDGDEGRKDKKASVSATVAVIYNGQPLDEFKKSDIEITDGNIRLVNNDGKNEYDVMYIESYKTVIVDKISNMNMTVDNIYTYDYNNRIIDFYKNNDDSVKIFGASGEIEFSDINPGDVIKITQSEVNGRKVLNAYVSSKKISGMIGTMRNNEDIIVTIGDIEYTLSEEYKKALSKNDAKAVEVKVGGNYTFYLDVDGEIAYAKEETGMLKYGIVFATATETGSFVDNCFIKLYTEDGEWKEYGFAEKIVFNDANGVTHKIEPDKKVGELPASSKGEISVVGYTLNSEGKINRLDVPVAYVNGTEDKFNVKKDVKLAYRSNNQSFDSEIYTEADATVWIVNGNMMNQKEGYLVGALTDLSADASYTISAYGVDEFGFADYIVVNDTGSGYGLYINNSGLFLVESIGEAMGPEGEIVGTVTGMMGKYDSITFFCDDDAILSDLGAGDVISLHADKRGYIDGKVTYRKYTSDIVYQNPGGMHGRPVILQGVVLKNEPTNARIKIDCGNGAVRALRTNAGISVFIYDTQKKMLMRGSVNDIETGDKIMAKIVMSSLYGFVVFR